MTGIYKTAVCVLFVIFILALVGPRVIMLHLGPPSISEQDFQDIRVAARSSGLHLPSHFDLQSVTHDPTDPVPGHHIFFGISNSQTQKTNFQHIASDNLESDSVDFVIQSAFGKQKILERYKDQWVAGGLDCLINLAKTSQGYLWVFEVRQYIDPKLPPQLKGM